MQGSVIGHAKTIGRAVFVGGNEATNRTARVFRKPHRRLISPHNALTHLRAYGCGDFRFFQVFPPDRIGSICGVPRPTRRFRCVQAVEIRRNKKPLLIG